MSNGKKTTGETIGIGIVLFLVIIVIIAIVSNITASSRVKLITPDEVHTYDRSVLSRLLDDEYNVKIAITPLKEADYNSKLINNGGLLSKAHIKNEFYYSTKEGVFICSETPLTQFIGKSILVRGKIDRFYVFKIYSIIEIGD